MPSDPGWSFESSYYHASADASRGISFERGGAIQAGMKSPSDFFMFTPTYAFATPIFGAQAAFGTTILYGKNATSVSATLTGPGGNTLSGSKSDEVLAFGDIYPTATLKWNKDVHNFMVYATTGIPVGAYQLTRLSALGWIGRAMARAETAPDRRRDLAQDQARVAGKGRNARKAPSASFAAGRKARKARRAGRSNP